MLPFWLSIVALSLVQGALVALPRAHAQAGLAGLRARRWAAIPPLSVLAFVLIARAAERASAQALTYLALAAVPVLAVIALGWLGRGARPRAAIAAVPLFALAWVDRGGLAGEGAAVVLSALSCVALGALLAALTPPRWLGGGSSRWPWRTQRWWSRTCCRSRTAPSTRRTPRPACRGCRAPRSARR
jgi:hypothetical protein